MTFATSALALLSAAPGETALPADSAPAFFLGQEPDEHQAFPASEELAELAGLFGQLLESDEGDLEPIPQAPGEGEPSATADSVARVFWTIQPGLVVVAAPVEQTKPIEALNHLLKSKEPAAVLRWATPAPRVLVTTDESALQPAEAPAQPVPGPGNPEDETQAVNPAFCLLLRPAPKATITAKSERSVHSAPILSPAQPTSTVMVEGQINNQSGGQQLESESASADLPSAQPRVSVSVFENCSLPKLKSDWSSRPKEMNSGSVASGDERADGSLIFPEEREAAPVTLGEAREPAGNRDEDLHSRGEGHVSANPREQQALPSGTDWPLTAEKALKPIGAEMRPSPRPEASRMDHLIAPDTKLETPPQPVRELVVQLPGQEGRAVEIRFVDRRNTIEVTARTQRQQDAIPLQHNLDQLRERLSGQGFTSEVMPSSAQPEWESWLPAHEAAPSAARESMVAASAAGQAMTGPSDGQSSGDGQRKGLAMWLNQLEDSLDGEAEGDREESK